MKRYFIRTPSHDFWQVFHYDNFQIVESNNDYKAGDVLHQHEIDENGKATGAEMSHLIGAVLVNDADPSNKTWILVFKELIFFKKGDNHAPELRCCTTHA